MVISQYIFVFISSLVSFFAGLDPAGAGFEIAYLTGVWYKALNPGDAEFVDVIYTSIGNLGLGINTVVGDANFYPNGGTSPQPGCNKFYPCKFSENYTINFHVWIKKLSVLN